MSFHKSLLIPPLSFSIQVASLYQIILYLPIYILNNQRLLTLSAAFDTQSQCVSEYIEFHSYLIQVFYAKLP